jgi:DNA repair protein RadC
MDSYLDLPLGLKPREKLQHFGVEMVSTEELLHLILGSGSGKVLVTSLAKEVAQRLQEKRRLTLDELLKIKGIGLAKAAQILAAIELVERLRPVGYPVIDSLKAVLNQAVELRTFLREHIVCLYLNARLQLLLKETISVGSLNQSIISPRDVFSVIKYHPVMFVIVVHNHPSGDASPSPADFLFTHHIWQAGQILGVEMIDHVIVGARDHYSFKEQGALEKMQRGLPPSAVNF